QLARLHEGDLAKHTKLDGVLATVTPAIGVDEGLSSTRQRANHQPGHRLIAKNSGTTVSLWLEGLDDGYRQLDGHLILHRSSRAQLLYRSCTAEAGYARGSAPILRDTKCRCLHRKIRCL